VAPRVSPTTRVRAQMDALFNSDRDLAAILEDVGRLTVRFVMQQAIEAEVDAFLGRGRYERRTDEAPSGSRNGWQPPIAVKTTMGPVELSRPKLRGTDEKFCSQLFGLGVTRTNALEALSSPPGCGGCPIPTSRPRSVKCSATKRRSAARR
jgi:putative transposase